MNTIPDTSFRSLLRRDKFPPEACIKQRDWEQYKRDLTARGLAKDFETIRGNTTQHYLISNIAGDKEGLIGVVRDSALPIAYIIH